MFRFSVEKEKPLKKEQVPKINQGLACEYHYPKKSKEPFSTSSDSGTEIVLRSSDTGSVPSGTFWNFRVLAQSIVNVSLRTWKTSSVRLEIKRCHLQTSEF